MQAGWKRRKLGELLDAQNGFAFDSEHFSDLQGMPLVRIRDLKDGTSTAVRYKGEYDKRFVVRAGDLLIGMDGEFRCYAWRGSEALLNQRVCRLIDFSDEIEPEFVGFGINAHLKQIEDATPYVTVKHLSAKSIREIEFSYPGRSEQRQIVARIKECMERVEEIEANAATVARELDALFPALLNERFSAIKDAHGARLLEDIADIRGGSSLPKGAEIDEGTKSVLLVKVGDMNAAGNERTIGAAREFLPRAKAGRGVIEAGAVIFPKRGGAIATNKKRLLGRPALLDPNLMAVVAKRDVLRPDYLYYWCLALDLSKLSNGGVIPQLNRKDLAPLELPVPEISVQGQIVEELQQSERYCSQLKMEFESAQAEWARLREAILRKAFAGAL